MLANINGSNFLRDVAECGRAVRPCEWDNAAQRKKDALLHWVLIEWLWIQQSKRRSRVTENLTQLMVTQSVINAM